MSKDKNDLLYIICNGKYPIIFTPKYRRQMIYGKIKNIVRFYVHYAKKDLKVLKLEQVRIIFICA